METQNYEQLALNEAKKSLAKKRKVGAIIINAAGIVLSTGFNYNPLTGKTECEDENGNTLPEVIHAEVSAIAGLDPFDTPKKIYITHQPCENCLNAIKECGIEDIIVVNAFMKFDTTKPRYDLIPPSATKALANVLTYGAKKYKPNNWKEVDDPNRYIAAAMRHFEAYRAGEVYDEESKLPHLHHLLTNIAFLIDLDWNPNANN